MTKSIQIHFPCFHECVTLPLIVFFKTKCFSFFMRQVFLSKSLLLIHLLPRKASQHLPKCLRPHSLPWLYTLVTLKPIIWYQLHLCWIKHLFGITFFIYDHCFWEFPQSVSLDSKALRKVVLVGKSAESTWKFRKNKSMLVDKEVVAFSGFFAGIGHGIIVLVTRGSTQKMFQGVFLSSSSYELLRWPLLVKLQCEAVHISLISADHLVVGLER